jgi:hypothetical protein
MGDQTNPPERWTLRGLGGGRQVTAAGGPAIRLNERRDVVDAEAYEQAIRERDEVLSNLGARNGDLWVLQAECDRLREALEFYADRKNYVDGAPGHSSPDGDGGYTWEDDDGLRARAALSAPSVEGDDEPAGLCGQAQRAMPDWRCKRPAGHAGGHAFWPLDEPAAGVQSTTETDGPTCSLCGEPGCATYSCPGGSVARVQMAAYRAVPTSVPADAAGVIAAAAARAALDAAHHERCLGDVVRRAVARHAQTLDNRALGYPDADKRDRDSIDNELYNAVRALDPEWWDRAVPGLNGPSVPPAEPETSDGVRKRHKSDGSVWIEDDRQGARIDVRCIEPGRFERVGAHMRVEPSYWDGDNWALVDPEPAAVPPVSPQVEPVAPLTFDEIATAIAGREFWPRGTREAAERVRLLLIDRLPEAPRAEHHEYGLIDAVLPAEGERREELVQLIHGWLVRAEGCTYAHDADMHYDALREAATPATPEGPDA